VKRRAFLQAFASVVTAPWWAKIPRKVRNRVVAPLISKVGQVFSFSIGSTGVWPSYAEAY
jgi:hypothetical protein